MAASAEAPPENSGSGNGTGNMQPAGSLGTGVQLDDFWMMAHKPHLNRDGVYKLTGQDEHAGHLKTDAQLEEEEEKRPAPRRVIPVSEVEKFIDHFWPRSERMWVRTNH